MAMRGIFWALVVLVFGGVLAAGIWSIVDRSRAARVGPLPVLKGEPIPDFTLTESSGRTVTRNDLLGNIWLANFVFTRCAGPCPELSLRMRSIQQALTSYGADVKLVTFSLDPRTDSPAVLREYAQRFHADTARWWFLTGGDEAAMHRLIREGFLQVVVPATAEAPLTHSEYFVLVDRLGRIRAFYGGREAESKAKILSDIDTLVTEKGSP